jgi:hypothetical protein
MVRDTVTDSPNSHEAWDDDERDDLDDLIAEIAQEHPEFPAMVEAALRERQAARVRGEDPTNTPQGEEDTQEQPAATSNTQA